MRIAWGERVGCKSRFALVFKNSAGRRCGFRVKMRGTSSLHGKLTGDFGNASEAGRISDCLPSRVFTKKQSLCNFRLLQQNLPEADVDLRADTEHSRAILQRPLSGWKPTRTVPPVVDGLTRKRGPSKCLSRRNGPGSRIASTFSASRQSDTPTLLDGSLRTITRGWRSRAPPILAGHGFCARGGCCRATC